MSNISTSSTTTLSTAADLYQFLDSLFDLDADSDTLFAGGYIRGLSSLVATDFGDESQSLSPELLTAISIKIEQAKSELSPQDYAIVNNFWLEIKAKVKVS